jgi:protein SCO1/2
MKRRYFIRAACATTAVSTGCLTSSGSPDDTVLPPPEEQYADSEDLPYPAYGEKFPEFTLPDPVTGGEFDTSDFNRATIVSPIYTTCPAECIMVGNRLAGVQNKINESGYTDEAVFISLSFDPKRDDAEALEDYGKRMGADLESGNWRFLLPEDQEEAKRIVSEKLGVGFQRDGAEFIHMVLTFLVNPDGYVERTYRGEILDVDTVASDIETVANEY